MIFGPSHSFIWLRRSVLWKRCGTAYREKQQYEEEGRKGRKHLAEDRRTPRTDLGVLLPQTVSSSMGLAGKQSKKQNQQMRAGSWDSTQGAEPAGSAAVSDDGVCF